MLHIKSVAAGAAGLLAVASTFGAPPGVAETKEAVSPRWSVEKAHAWGAANPWWCGVNYIPANAVNYTAMWDSQAQVALMGLAEPRTSD